MSESEWKRNKEILKCSKTIKSKSRRSERESRKSRRPPINHRVVRASKRTKQTQTHTHDEQVAATTCAVVSVWRLCVFGLRSGRPLVSGSGSAVALALALANKSSPIHLWVVCFWLTELKFGRQIWKRAKVCSSFQVAAAAAAAVQLATCKWEEQNKQKQKQKKQKKVESDH